MLSLIKSEDLMRRRYFVLVVVGLGLMLGPLALALPAAGANPQAIMNAHPQKRLVPGQTIRVLGSDFTPGTQFYLSECNNKCTGWIGPITTKATGDVNHFFTLPLNRTSKHLYAFVYVSGAPDGREILARCSLAFAKPA
jgi:hypothetical protein